MVALDFALTSSFEVVIAGASSARDTKEMLKIIQKQFVPNMVIIFRPTEEQTPVITRIAKFSKDMKEINGKPAAYICHNYICQAPLVETDKIIEILTKKTESQTE
jgi:uncharacterized protein YyaL (SSP411 family)